MFDPAKDLTDSAFLSAFLDGTLPARLFDHAGHLRAAWLVLRSQSLDEAISTVSRCIAVLALQFGAPDKFHRTLTEAMVRIVAARMQRDRSLDWTSFLATNTDLLQDAHQVLRQHYSDELLASSAARAEWVPPDRMPFPG